MKNRKNNNFSISKLFFAIAFIIVVFTAFFYYEQVLKYTYEDRGVHEFVATKISTGEDVYRIGWGIGFKRTFYTVHYESIDGENYRWSRRLSGEKEVERLIENDGEQLSLRVLYIPEKKEVVVTKFDTLEGYLKNLNIKYLIPIGLGIGYMIIYFVFLRKRFRKKIDLMRDSRCDMYLVKKYRDDMKSDIEEYKKVAEQAEGHAFNSVYASIINMRFYALRYGYILGSDLNQLHKEYLEISNDFQKIDYLVHSNNIVDILALGILFEDSIENLKKIVELGDLSKVNDIVFDYLANGCGIKRTFNSKYFQDDDNKVLTEIIKLAHVDNKKASEKFVDYIKNEFPKNYWGEDWKGDVGEKFLGVCLYAYAAIAKILNLDDSSLKDNPYYTYDLVHYKKGMKFFPEETGDMFKNYKKGISEYKELEKLIPVQFHEEANRVFLDHKNLSDEEFYKKYKIDHATHYMWELEDYIEHKNEPYLFGFLLVCALADSGYLLDISSPEEIKEYAFYNFWEDIEDIEVKAINFNVDNGYYYLAYIPKDVQIESILDVKIENVKDLKEFDEYEEEF